MIFWISCQIFKYTKIIFCRSFAISSKVNRTIILKMRCNSEFFPGWFWIFFFFRKNSWDFCRYFVKILDRIFDAIFVKFLTAVNWKKRFSVKCMWLFKNSFANIYKGFPNEVLEESQKKDKISKTIMVTKFKIISVFIRYKFRENLNENAIIQWSFHF